MIKFFHTLSVIGTILSGILTFASLTAIETWGGVVFFYAICALIGCILNILFYGELETMKSDIEENKKKHEKKIEDIINHLNAAIRSINRMNQEAANKPKNSDNGNIVKKEVSNEHITE